MKISHLIYSYVILSVVAFCQDSYSEDDDDIDVDTSEEEEPPKVFWRPIVQRNMTDIIQKALDSNEYTKLAKISKFLNYSYEIISRDMEEGLRRIEALKLDDIRSNIVFDLMTSLTHPLIITLATMSYLALHQ